MIILLKNKNMTTILQVEIIILQWIENIPLVDIILIIKELFISTTGSLFILNKALKNY